MTRACPTEFYQRLVFDAIQLSRSAMHKEGNPDAVAHSAALVDVELGVISIWVNVDVMTLGDKSDISAV